MHAHGSTEEQVSSYAKYLARCPAAAPNLSGDATDGLEVLASNADTDATGGDVGAFRAGAGCADQYETPGSSDPTDRRSAAQYVSSYAELIARYAAVGPNLNPGLLAGPETSMLNDVMLAIVADVDAAGCADPHETLGSIDPGDQQPVGYVSSYAELIALYEAEEPNFGPSTLGGLEPSTLSTGTFATGVDVDGDQRTRYASHLEGPSRIDPDDQRSIEAQVSSYSEVVAQWNGIVGSNARPRRQAFHAAERNRSTQLALIEHQPSVADEDGPRCSRCGARVAILAPEELLTLRQIMQRYHVKRTKALILRREVRRRFSLKLCVRTGDVSVFRRLRSIASGIGVDGSKLGRSEDQHGQSIQTKKEGRKGTVSDLADALSRLGPTSGRLGAVQIREHAHDE
jgi:hypothetical protein